MFDPDMTVKQGKFFRQCALKTIQDTKGQNQGADTKSQADHGHQTGVARKTGFLWRPQMTQGQSGGKIQWTDDPGG